jgi:hypothetical protein
MSLDILTIGSSKQLSRDLMIARSYFLDDETIGNVYAIDRSYCETSTKYSFDVFSERDYTKLKFNMESTVTFVNKDVIDGLNYFYSLPQQTKFDAVIACRVFEHFTPHDILYLLYLLKDLTKSYGNLVIIVPDFDVIIKEVQNFSVEKSFSEMELSLIRIITEIFNEPSDPHRSIWNRSFASYYLTLEKYWDIEKMCNVTLDNRQGYYLLIHAKKNVDSDNLIC